MSNELSIQEKPMSIVEVKTQINSIQYLLKEVLIEGEHYGVLPGCGKKKALFKSGAEKISMMFRLACSPEAEDLSTPDEIRYRVKAHLKSKDGLLVGTGIGECSTNEEKYKWRRAVCTEEYQEAPENMRRKKWSSYQGKASQTEQIRTNPSDLANTVLKMAKKRALVDAVLTATAASDCFVQDIEDLPEEIAEGVLQGETQASTKPAVSMPEKKTDGASGPAQPPEGSPEILVCSDCQEEISEKVHKYSTEKLGKALCFTCQKKAGK